MRWRVRGKLFWLFVLSLVVLSRYAVKAEVEEIPVVTNTDVVKDELGQEYEISWGSSEATRPQVSKYDQVPINQIIDETVRYSISELDMIYFQMPELKTHALISTEVSEEPDLILSFDKENNVLEWIPFSTEEGRTSFHISRGSIIIPIKYVAQAEGPIKQQRVVIGADYGEGLLRQAAVTQDSDTRMFQIINNSNCVFKVELSALRGLSSSQIREKGYDDLYVIIREGTKETTKSLDDTFTFSYTAQKSGIVNIKVMDKTKWLLWSSEDEIWEQDIYVQKKYSLAQSQMNELLEKYAPIVVYNQDEKYAPMDLNDIFKQIPSKTISFKTVLGDKKVASNDLQKFMAYNGNNEYLLDFNDDLINNGEYSFKKITGNFNRATVYKCFQEDDKYYYLTYYFIYGFDEKNAAGITGLANHNFDRESMTVVLDKNKEPLSVLTGGHLDSTKMSYVNDSKSVFSWTHERVDTDYKDCISNYSQGHPIVYIEKGAHCVYPLAGYYDTGAAAVAGLTESILDGDGSFIEEKLIALLPETFDTTSDGIKKYSMKVLDIDKMYGNNVLNFSGYWVDILDDPISAITGNYKNTRFPPFLSRDYNKFAWYTEATKFDITGIELSKKTKRTKEEFNNAYLFSIGDVKNFGYVCNGNNVNLSWDGVQGASGYKLVITCNGKDQVISLGPNAKTYSDVNNNNVSSGYSYAICATYDVNVSSYQGTGKQTVSSNYVKIDHVSLD